MLGAVGATAVMLVQQAEQEWALPLLLLLVFALLALTGWSMFALRRHINQQVQAEQERDQFSSYRWTCLAWSISTAPSASSTRRWNVFSASGQRRDRHLFFDYVHKEDIGPTLKAVTDKLLNGEPITYYETASALAMAISNGCRGRQPERCMSISTISLPTM